MHNEQRPSHTLPSRAFVVGAYAPHGGTWMAYQLGLIAHRHFNMAVTVVGGDTTAHGMFHYEPEFPSIAFQDLEGEIRPDDLLICNPSYSSHNLGLRLPCKKLMYIQGFTTFATLDRFFDRYVTVSTFVHDFIKSTYGLDTPIIPAFIDVEPRVPATDWSSRPVHSMTINLKGGDQQLLLSRLRELIRQKAPDIEGAIDWENSILSAKGHRPHEQLMSEIGAARYMLTLSAAEGFGLVPLEAMAQGVVVLGFDGFGGRQYMQPGLNCGTCAYPDLEGVVDSMVEIMRSPERGQVISEAARVTASQSQYSYGAFEAAWINQFEMMFRPKQSCD